MDCKSGKYSTQEVMENCMQMVVNSFVKFVVMYGLLQAQGDSLISN